VEQADALCMSMISMFVASTSQH